MSKLFNNVKFVASNELALDDEIYDIVFTDNLNTVTLLNYCIEKKINHFVQKSNLNYVSEISVSETMLHNKDCFFNFPLSVIHGVENPNLETEKQLQMVSFHISSATEKSSLLKILENYILSISGSTALMGDVLRSADELFTNAVYNAPFVPLDNSQSGIERNIEKVIIESDKKPHFFASHDEQRLVIGCTDNYGSLNIEALLVRIKRCYEANLSEVINYGSGGARIGAYLVFESSCSMYISVKKGHQTLICCSFPYKMNSNKRSRIPKNLHVFNA